MSAFGTTLPAYGFRYRGVEFGSGTRSKIVDLRGLFDTNVRNGDRLIPRGDGAFRGSHFALPREIIVDLRIEGDLDAVTKQPGDQLIARVDALEAAFQRSESDEYPFEFLYPGEGQRFVNARVVARTRPRRWSTELGVVEMAVRLSASDPRQYGITLQSVSGAVYSPTIGGLDYSITEYGKDFAPTTGGDLVAQNDGNEYAYPKIQVFGPSTGSLSAFTVTNRTNGDVLSVTDTIGVGQVLTADMAAAVDGSGGTVIDLSGTAKYGSWDVPRLPFRLSPGSNVIRFEATGTTTDVAIVISWRDTYI